MIELNKYVKGKDLDGIMNEYRTALGALMKDAVRDGVDGVDHGRISERLKDMISAAQQGDGNELNRLVCVSIPIIIAISLRYRDRGLTLIELLSLGTDELVKIVQNPECLTMSDIEFVKHYVTQIKQIFELSTKKNA